ncbi:site-specific integrase [Nocardia wallacei]|uniref:site-specific integrase n=1 Tax=Nocardia wallacei TaxID=480035 RepID=UPI002456BC01|nr:site-specific integrase [Nocardia wallacei]
MPKIRGEGKPYKETRKKTVTDRKTGEKRTVEYVLWCWRVELDRKPNGERDYTVIRRKNKNDLIPAKRALLAKIANGEPLKKDTTTIEAWLRYWLDNIAKTRMRPNPWKGYVSAVRCNIVPHIGKVKLTDLEPKHVRYMLAEILKTGKSARTAEIAYNVLHIALADAMKEPGLALRRNVVELVNKPRARSNSQDAGTRKTLPSGSKGRIQKSRKSLTSDQAKAVIQTSREAGDPLAVRWAMALLTGVRKGECLGLTRDRVDLEAGTFDLSWALAVLPLKRKKGEPLPEGDVYPVEAFDATDDYEIKPLYKASCLVRPKTNESVRALPIPGPLLALLREHIENMAPNEYGLLWVNSKGKPIRPNVDDAAWAAALARAGAPDVVMHAARHTTATLLLEARVPEDVRMAIMGHSSAAAQRIYAHADMGVKRAGLEKLDDLITAAVVDVRYDDEEALALPAAPDPVGDEDSADAVVIEIAPAPAPGDWRNVLFQSAS